MNNLKKSIETKFQSLVHGLTHLGSAGIAGTNSDIRTAVWNEFRKTFKDGVCIAINGWVVNLKANHSLSGKSTSYIGTISDTAYFEITGSIHGLSKKGAYVTIDLGIVTICGGGNHYQKIDNSLIKIID